MDTIRHLTYDELTAGLERIRQAPSDGGTLRLIVVRPASEERISLEECELSPEAGVDGDNWATSCWARLDDGRSDPEVQVTITNSRVIELIAQHESRWPLAGDQLYVDLDLSHSNLPVGQRLAIGPVVLEITEHPHTGCKKFAHRFGHDALRFVNAGDGKALRLRGVYARIVEAGTARVGDEIRKLS